MIATKQWKDEILLRLSSLVTDSGKISLTLAQEIIEGVLTLVLILFLFLLRFYVAAIELEHGYPNGMEKFFPQIGQNYIQALPVL